MDARQEEEEARKLEAKAESERAQATRLEQNAEAHEKIGDETRAGVEHKQAEQLAREAEELQSKAQALHAESGVLIATARNKQKELDKLTRDYMAKKAELETEIKRLAGGLTLI